MSTIEYTNRTYVSLVLRGKDLDPQEVNESIGIIPSRSFKRGDIRKGNKKWPHGYWELESTAFVQSSDLPIHLEWLVAKLEPIKTTLISIVSHEGINAEISCFWILPSSHESLSLSPELLKRIASLGVKINIDIYCHD